MFIDQNSKNKIEGGGDLPWIALEDLQVLPAENWAKTIKSQNVKECANLLSIEQQLPSKIRLALVETLLQHTSDQNLLKNIFLASLTRDDLSSFLQQMDFKNVVKLMRLSIDLLQVRKFVIFPVTIIYFRKTKKECNILADHPS